MRVMAMTMASTLQYLEYVSTIAKNTVGADVGVFPKNNDFCRFRTGDIQRVRLNC